MAGEIVCVRSMYLGDARALSYSPHRPGRRLVPVSDDALTYPVMSNAANANAANANAANAKVPRAVGRLIEDPSHRVPQDVSTWAWVTTPGLAPEAACLRRRTATPIRNVTEEAR